MKNTVFVRAFVAPDVIAKTINLAFRVSDLLEISSDGESVVIRKVACSLCGGIENVRQYGRDKWVCDPCAEAISKGAGNNSKFVDTPGGYHAGNAEASSSTESTKVRRSSYADDDKEFEQRNGVGV